MPRGYGEGDQFFGVNVPEQCKLAKSVFAEVSLGEIAELLQNQYHEIRLTAIFIL